MSLKDKNIVVIGAGIGGLTAAIAAAQRGAKVTVLEQADAIREVGAGLQISPNGKIVLEALGLGAAVSECSIAAKAVELRDYRNGRLVTSLDLGIANTTGTYLFVHRAAFIKMLYDAARDAGVKIRLLQRAVSVSPGEKPAVVFSNGDVVQADLIVGADGLHSIVRLCLENPSKPFFTRQVAWRSVVDNVTRQGPVARVTMGPKRHVVTYPLAGGQKLNVVAVQERTEWAEEGWHHKDDPKSLKKAFGDFGGEISTVLDAVADVGIWGLFRHPVAENWYGEGVALLGDAAHPTLPFMAQGAVMAIEDAWVLMACLDQSKPRQLALADYQNRRLNRVRKVVETANGNAWKYHLSFPPLRFAAHSAMRLLGQAAPERMVRQFDWIYQHDVTKEPL